MLREAYDRGIPDDDDGRATRLRLAAALAFRGDNRGLPAALDELTKLANPGRPPLDDDAKKKWQSQLDDRRGAALDVFARAGTKGVVEILTQHASDNSTNTRLALLQILDQLHTLPDAVRPHVEKWAADPSSKSIAAQATRLLSGHR